MSQSDFGTINAATKSGSALATDLNSWRNALHSNHKGSAEPSYKATGITWLDDSADPIWIYKVYDGTTWIPLLEIDATANVAVPAGITSRLKFPLAGGSANALTLTPTVAMTAYADQDVVTFEAASNNSGAATLNISGVGAKAIRKIIGGTDVALVSGDLRDGGRYQVNYDAAANSAAGAWILTSLPITLGTTPDTAAAGNDARFADPIMRGQIFGLEFANNAADATNDIDIAAGQCASADVDPVLMILASALTKRLDAAWAVGNNNGGLDTGSVANTTYHVWLIRRPDTGVVDALFSASATSPTMPANYTQKRYLGPIVRASSAIRGFSQSGDVFFWNSKITDRSSTAAFATALLTLSVPTGINVKPILENSVSINVSSAATTSIGSAAAGTVQQQLVNIFVGATSGIGTQATPPPVFETDTSGRIYYQVVVGSGSISGNNLNTLGFIFERGR